MKNLTRKSLFLLALGAVFPVSRPTFAQEAPQVALPQVALPEVASPQVAAAPFLWQLRLKAGQKWNTTTQTSTRSVQEIPGFGARAAGARAAGAPTTLESTSQSRVVTEQNVLSSDEKGARVEVIYREMSQNSKMVQGDKVVFDSANAPAEMRGLNEILNGVTGAKISYLLASDGKISEIQGIEAYVERINAALSKAVEQNPAMVPLQNTMRGVMSGFLSPEAIQSSFGSAYRAMPTNSVAPGEIWKSSFAMPMNGTTFTVNTQSTFESRRNGVVTIAQKGEFSTDAGAQFQLNVPGAVKVPLPAPPEGKTPEGKTPEGKTPLPVMQLDLRGVSTGQMRVDENSGLTIYQNTVQEMEGELVMSGATGKGSVLSLPMKIKTEITATTEEVKTTP